MKHAAPAVAVSTGVNNPSARFLDGLQRLAEAVCHEARLTESGMRSYESAITGLLATNQQTNGLLCRHPAVAKQKIDRPIFVTGLHRSGTTLLHRLLSHHSALRAPALWELQAPADQTDRETLRQRAAAYVREYNAAAPGFQAAHHLHPDSGDECHRLLAPTFRSWIFGVRYRVPGYENWLAGQDMRAAYQQHRLLLQAITWRNPAQRAVLKDPFHLRHPAELQHAYPDALVIRIHRDPGEAVPSACALTATIRAARSGPVDPAEIGAEWLQRTDQAVRAMVPRGWAVPGGPAVHDVLYTDLLADPMRVLATICDFTGIAFGHATEARMTHFLARNPAGRHGRHSYTPQQFGLDRSRINLRYAAYVNMFGIPAP